MHKRTEPKELAVGDRFEMVTAFKNGNLLTTTLNKISFIWDCGNKKFQHFAITDDQKSLLDMVRSLQIEIKSALSLSRHILRPGEVKFELLARDPQAPHMVRHWAKRRARFEPTDPKVKAAMAIADAMEAWKKAHPLVGMHSRLMTETPESITEAAQELLRLAESHGLKLSIESGSVTVSRYPTP